MTAQPPTEPLRQPSVVRNVNEEHERRLTRMDRLALGITERVGTMGFFLLILTWTICWLGWNFLAPEALQFDPPTAFVLWLFISNMIQILLMPLIMVGQNLQGQHAELRAESDYAINVKAEREIEAILQQLAEQRQLLQQLTAQLGSGAPGDRAPTAPPTLSSESGPINGSTPQA